MPDNFEQRLGLIEDRLARIEDYLTRNPQMPPEQKGLSKGDVTVVHSKPAPIKSSGSSAASTNLIDAKIAAEGKSGHWLGIAAVVCFVLAAAFIVKLSIESGWLTPERQLGLAMLLGFTLIGAGFALMKSDREYASLLPGAGVIVLYLTVFAGHRFYSLIPFETAILITSAVSALCVWLYIKIKHDVYPITAAVGAYLSPIVLGFESTSVFTVYYFILCSLAFSMISIWVESRLLTMISAYLAILLTGLIGSDLGMDKIIAVTLFLHFLIFSIGTYVYTQHLKKPLSETEAWSFLPVLLVFYAMEYSFISRFSPQLAPWISLVFAGLLLSLYVSAKKWFPAQNLASQPMIAAFVTIVSFHAIYLELMPDSLRPWLFVVILLSGAFLYPMHRERAKAAVWRIPALALMAILAIEYVFMILLLIGGTGLWLALSSLASIWAVLALRTDELKKHEEYSHVLLASAHVLAVFGFYRLTHGYGSLAVSASWLLYAIGVIFFAFHRKDEVMAKSAVFVLGFAAAKALLYDASSAPTVIRILCLLLTGVALYGSGFLLRKIAKWT